MHVVFSRASISLAMLNNNFCFRLRNCDWWRGFSQFSSKCYTATICFISVLNCTMSLKGKKTLFILTKCQHTYTCARNSIKVIIVLLFSIITWTSTTWIESQQPLIFVEPSPAEIMIKNRGTNFNTQYHCCSQGL